MERIVERLAELHREHIDLPTSIPDVRDKASRQFCLTAVSFAEGVRAQAFPEASFSALRASAALAAFFSRTARSFAASAAVRGSPSSMPR